MSEKQIYQTILLESNNYQSAKNDLELNLYELKETGNFFLIVNNEYENDFIEYSIFDYIELFIKHNLKFINTIIIPKNPTKRKHLNNNIRYLLWFVKDNDKMQFFKDNIREKHIWKDVEWGKRKKNYNDKGKDPSNIWIPTIDDGKGKITKHIDMSLEAVINRCILSTTTIDEMVLIKHFSDLNENELKKNRNVTIIKQSVENVDRNESEHESNIENNQDIKLKADIFFKSSENMIEINNSSVDSMITSPPYWDLKNYFKDGQIGQESYQEYLDRLNTVWKETYRVLKDTGSMWININNRTKNKKPILIAQDIIKECKKIGFFLKDIIIWHKSSGIPTHNNNLVDKHEYVLWFVKSSNYKFNHEYVTSVLDYKNEKLNYGLIWNINRKAGSVGSDFIHPAIYPIKLIDRIINLSTSKNDVVLDPFLGSGTTMISALNNDRNFIGYEYNEGFVDLIKHRAEQEKVNSQFINMHIKGNISKDEGNIYRSKTKK